MTDKELDEIAAYLDYSEVRFDEAMHMLGRLIPQLIADYRAMREIVTAVAGANSQHAGIVDAWVLLFDNHTVSYLQDLLRKARELTTTPSH